MRTCPALLLVLAALALSTPVVAQSDPTGSFEEEAKRYEASLRRPAFYLRALAAERFARTHDARALRALLGRYLQPEQPDDAVRALLAGVAAEAFDGEEHLAVFQDVTRRAATSPDAWLWFHALGLEAKHRGAEGVIAVAADGKRDAFLRAAALAALEDESRADAALAAIPRVLGPPGGARLRGLERVALLEACAWALAGAKGKLSDPAFAPAATLVIDGLDDKKLEMRSRLVVARALAVALRSDALHLEAGPWRDLLAARGQEAQAPAADGATRARVTAGGGITTPRFLGIEGSGVRIAFVIDLSDSMLEPLTRAEVEDMRIPTGGGAATGAAPRPNPDADLPWDRIKNRFDAAREALKGSLKGLGDKMAFAVVVFGTKAEPLLGTGLVRATPQNIARAVAALDAIRPGKPIQDRPNGTLRGYTNLHGGLRAAFRLTEAAPIPAQEHVAPAGFATGCDTIFLLSDGAPSWDDYDCEDIAAEGMEAGDPETGASDGASEELHYYGPYVEQRFLLADVRRMNLFRRVELHCIGIGEAEPELLRELATLGRGELRTIPAAR